MPANEMHQMEFKIIPWFFYYNCDCISNHFCAAICYIQLAKFVDIEKKQITEEQK
jgi:hypothetical protein